MRHTVDEGDAVRREIVVRQHGALCGAGGARRVDDQGRIVAIEIHGRSGRLASRRHGAQRRDIPQRSRVGIDGIRVGLDDDRTRLGVAHDMAQLALAIQDVHRHEDHAEPGAREKEIEELDAVAEVRAEAIAPAQPARRELVRHAAGARVDVAEGERADRAGSVGILEADAIGTATK